MTPGPESCGSTASTSCDGNKDGVARGGTDHLHGKDLTATGTTSGSGLALRMPRSSAGSRPRSPQTTRTLRLSCTMTAAAAASAPAVPSSSATSEDVVSRRCCAAGPVHRGSNQHRLSQQRHARDGGLQRYGIDAVVHESLQLDCGVESTRPAGTGWTTAGICRVFHDYFVRVKHDFSRRSLMRRDTAGAVGAPQARTIGPGNRPRDRPLGQRPVPRPRSGSAEHEPCWWISSARSR